MGVNQSPATTAADTGAGTAAVPAPGTEATAELNAVTIRRLGAVHLPSAVGRPTPSPYARNEEHPSELQSPMPIA